MRELELDLGRAQFLDEDAGLLHERDELFYEVLD
jgi:hypothetical protein